MLWFLVPQVQELPWRPRWSINLQCRRPGVGAGGRDPACQSRESRDTGLIPDLERCPASGHENSLQYFCLGNQKEGWQAMIHRVSKIGFMTRRLSTHAPLSPSGLHKSAQVPHCTLYITVLHRWGTSEFRNPDLL